MSLNLSSFGPETASAFKNGAPAMAQGNFLKSRGLYLCGAQIRFRD